MTSQTIRYGRSRLARFETKKVYTYEAYKPYRRAGIVKVGK